MTEMDYTGNPEMSSSKNETINVRDLASRLSTDMETICILTKEVQDALSNCDLHGTAPSDIRKLQHLDIITQSMTIYAEAIREISRRVPLDIMIPDGIFSLPTLKPLDSVNEGPGNSVTWL